MRVVGLDIEVRWRIRSCVEVGDLWGKVSWLSGKREVAGVRQLLGELQEYILVLENEQYFFVLVSISSTFCVRLLALKCFLQLFSTYILVFVIFLAK